MTANLRIPTANVNQIIPVSEVRDNLGRLRTSRHQNIYDADFEYGPQPLRWEGLTSGSGTITHLPGEGGVRMRLTTTSGDVTIRQTRPYHRYQPGKSMFMAGAITFGTPQTNHRQRVGFFDDSNGVFFEQTDPTTANPSGIGVVIRSDVGGLPVDTRTDLTAFNGNPNIASQIDWTTIQMVWIEYAWYGAGMIRWGVYLDGIPYVLHQYARGNTTGVTKPWARTGNLPVRYEQRNVGAVGLQNDFLHYGVSVVVDGGIDDQRGFTYSYGMAAATPRRTVALSSTRFPVLSIRNRVMGTLEAGNTTGVTLSTGAITAVSANTLTVTGTPMTASAYVGRFVAYGAAGATPTVARITANTTSVLTLADPVLGGNPAAAPVVGNNYTIGLVNRGQILPRQLLVSSTALCIIEIIVSTPSSPVTLTSPTFTALSTLGSTNSFAERDVVATGSVSGGEVVMAFTAPAGGSGLQAIDLSNLFALFNNIRGGAPDILTVAVTTPSAAASDVGAHLICQEAMS